MRDNTGRIAIPAGKVLRIEDVALDRMDWLVEGVDRERQTVTDAHRRNRARSHRGPAAAPCWRAMLVIRRCSAPGAGRRIRCASTHPFIRPVSEAGTPGRTALVRAAPLMLCGLCTAFPARAGVIIVGNEGAVVVGGLAQSPADLATLPSRRSVIA